MNFKNDIPIYIQVKNEIESEILSGKLKAGEKLLSVRVYASNFKVNPNTIVKALQELESIDLIYTDRTNGKFVTTNKVIIDKNRKKLASIITDEYITNLNKIGLSKKEIIDLVKENKLWDYWVFLIWVKNLIRN